MRWVIGIVTAFAVSLGANAQMDHSMGSASMKALENASGKTFDIYWMSQMIEHHKGALEMANSVLKEGKDARVKKAAQTVISDQSKEIKQLKGWLKSWYNTVPNAKQTALMRADMQPMLEGAMGSMDGMNTDADKRFLEGMIPHHQSAVEMGWLALKKAARPELRTFARKVVDVQSKEIKQYQSWLKGWK
jgi:uncharacterized protein (DUF305 family)